MSSLLRTIRTPRTALTACGWMVGVVLGGGLPQAHGATFEELITETAPPVGDAEVAQLKAGLVGAYGPVTFVNTRYLVNAKPPGGPVFLKPRGRTTNDKRPPKYNVLAWQLEVEGRMAVSPESIAEIAAYQAKLEREGAELEDALRSLSKEQRTASERAKVALRDRLRQTRSQVTKNKRDLTTTKVMHAAFEDAMQHGILELHFALVRATSAVAVNYHESTDTVSNLEQLAGSFALREPLLIFDGGFYWFDAKASGRFKRSTRLEPRAGSLVRSVLNDTYTRWGERCALLRKHVQDKGLISRCQTTRDQLLQWPGVIQRSEHLFWREAALPGPTSSDQALYLRPTRGGVRPAPAWPVLDYQRVRDCSTADLDYQRLRARGFADTLWVLERQPRYVAREQVIGRDWDASLAASYRDTGFMGATIFLRADGVIGIDNVFDDQHRWAYDEQGIALRLFAGAITLTIDPRFDGIMILNHVRAQDDRLYTYRARLLMDYPGRTLSRYSLDVDYRNSLKRRLAMPTPRPFCDENGRPITVARRAPGPASTSAQSTATQSPPKGAETELTASGGSTALTPGLQPLANASFEAPRVDQYQFAMKSWEGLRHGVVTPPATMFPEGLPPGGRQLAFLSKGGSWMAQRLPDPPAPGWTYTLQTWAGNRLEPGFESGHFHLELLAGESVVASQRFATPPKGEFAPFSLTYDAPAALLERALTVRIRNEDARQINFDLVRLYAYPQGSGTTPPPLDWENRRPTTGPAMTGEAPPGGAPIIPEIVGYWDYDAIDGQTLAAGLTLRPEAGGALGQRWTSVLELKAHDRLRARTRTLWPVELRRRERQVCINFPGYPSYQALIDFEGEEHDGLYAFGPCTEN